MTVEKNADVLDSFVRLDSTAKAGIFPKAVAEDLSLKYPTLTVGLRFTKVLGRESINRQRSGLAKEREALRQLIVRKEFDLERDWNDLDQQLRAARERYKLSLEMIETQTKRLQREKERNQFGRSTIFQVITVEGDLSQAEALRIRALGDMVRIVTKLKAFEVEA